MTGQSLGAVTATRGHLIEASLAGARIGSGARVHAQASTLAASVVAVHDDRVVLAPYGALDGIACGDVVVLDPHAVLPLVGTPLLGRVVDARGKPLDARPQPRGLRVARTAVAPAPGERRACAVPCWTGVRAIDGPLTFGRGARIGVFGPPGAGKSTLLDAIVRGCDADAIVVALVGERGREAERRLSAVDDRTTVVCATGDRPPAERVRAAELAFAQADALRGRGLHVLLVVDSLARFAAAAREVALAAGEAAGRGGYPPSVFAALARLLERAGPTRAGSVTLVATVLADGPEELDPVSDAARAALDGHLVLSESLVRTASFPALDLPRSASRTLADVATPDHRAAAQLVRAAVAALDASREARSLGIDASASDAFLGRCVAAEPALDAFLRQDASPSQPRKTLARLLSLAEILRS